MIHEHYCSLNRGKWKTVTNLEIVMDGKTIITIINILVIYELQLTLPPNKRGQFRVY